MTEAEPRNDIDAARAPADVQDAQGKRALFSDGPQRSLLGTFLVDCSACHRETPVSAADLVLAALPVSVHLPFIKRYHSLMRCPACGRRAWVRVIWNP